MSPLGTAADVARIAGARPVNPKEIAAARKVGQEFESVFLSQMIAHMFKGVGDDPILGGGEAGKLYRSMMQDEYGKVIARSGGIGVADSVMREVIKMQEKART